MINEFYKTYQIKDYLESTENINPRDYIDCSLGTNPFIHSGYIDPSYPKLKQKLIEIIKEDMDINVTAKNISFGSWHYGNHQKFMSVYYQ